MSQKLMPVLRTLPALLFGYGIVLTAASMAELRATASAAGMYGSRMNEVRVTLIASLVRSFYDLFYLWGMAILSLAALKYLDGEG